MRRTHIKTAQTMCFTYNYYCYYYFWEFWTQFNCIFYNSLEFFYNFWHLNCAVVRENSINIVQPSRMISWCVISVSIQLLIVKIIFFCKNIYLFYYEKMILMKYQNKKDGKLMYKKPWFANFFLFFELSAFRAHQVACFHSQVSFSSFSNFIRTSKQNFQNDTLTCDNVGRVGTCVCACVCGREAG